MGSGLKERDRNTVITGGRHRREVTDKINNLRRSTKKFRGTKGDSRWRRFN